MQNTLFDTTPETTAAAARIEIQEWTEKDKYGRTVRHFGAQAFRTRVVAARMPKAYIERYGKGRSYLINDWQMPLYTPEGKYIDPEASGKVTYVATLKEARAIAEAKVRAGVAAGAPARW